MHQRVATLERDTVGFQENLGRSRPANEARLRTRKRVGEFVVDRKAFAREPDRGRDQLRQGEFARAVSLMRERESRDRAGHADTERRVARLPGVGLAFLVEEGFARHRGRRGLAIVDGDRLVARRQMHQHEAAAADVAGLRMRHRERESDRNRGIDRVAAGFEDIDADTGRELLLARHHAVFGDDRKKACRIGEDRRRRGRGGLTPRRRRDDNEQSANQPTEAHHRIPHTSR